MPDPTDLRALVAEALARADDAHDAPWWWATMGVSSEIALVSPTGVILIAMHHLPSVDDQIFITHARSDVPVLAAALTTLADRQDAARGLLEEVAHGDGGVYSQEDGWGCLYCTAWYTFSTEPQSFVHRDNCLITRARAWLAAREGGG